MFKFSHLLGRAPSASEDDKDKEGTDNDKDKDDDCCDDNNEDKEKSKKSKKAKSSHADEGDDDDSDDDDDADAEEEDDDEDDKDENKDVKKGRKAERNRCATIFASKFAAGRPDMAATLAFNSTLSAKAAIEVLASAGPLQKSSKRTTLDERMQRLPAVKVGPDGESDGQSTSAVVSRATSLYNQAKGRK
jgi:hypothetical protein